MPLSEHLGFGPQAEAHSLSSAGSQWWKPGRWLKLILSCAAADGTSKIAHPLVGGLWEPAPPLYGDEAQRSQTWKRYIKFNGPSYTDGQSVRELVPHFEKATFTHGDIYSGNTLGNEKKGNDGSSGHL